MDENGNKCHKPIEEIKVGDKVWAYDEKTGENDWKPVVRLFRNETKAWHHVFVDGEEIVCTGGHPFYVADEGFVEAKNLKISDKLLLSDGRCVTIEKLTVETLEKAETTYNFEVADFHTYYVAESNVLVHNDCENPLKDIEYTDKVKKDMKRGDDHGFPSIVDNYGASGKKTSIIGGDGKSYIKLEIEGYYHDHKGIFEYIFDAISKICNHRFFRRI